jgi:hypothetical protein
MIMEVYMDLIGLFFGASVLSLSTAHFVETFLARRPKHYGVRAEGIVGTRPRYVLSDRPVTVAARNSPDYQITLTELG